MSNAKTGFLSALGAVLGGAAGATAGYYAQQARPRLRFGEARRRKRSRGQATEDAMVIGGATGAALGAFIGGTWAGEAPPPKQLR